MGSDQKENGIVTLGSSHSVAETVSRLERILETKGIKAFAVIDHDGEAKKAGLKMPETKLIIFGNPTAGTPLMLASPTIALDLPLKILIWEDTQAKVWVSYNSPEFLGKRHELPSEMFQTLSAVKDLAQAISV